jgi:heat shock 70kDa protein 1/2/6/8
MKKTVDPHAHPRVIRRLRTACEKAKRILSSSQETTIEIDALLDGQDFSTTITRALFEARCKHYFDQCMKPVEDVLRDGKMSKR